MKTHIHAFTDSKRRPGLSVCAFLVPALGKRNNPQAPEGVLSAVAEQRLLPMPAIDNGIPEDHEVPSPSQVATS